MKILIALVLAAGLSACAQHRLVVPRPNPTGEPMIVQSRAFAFGNVQPRIVADCDTNLINEVRIRQNFGDVLVTVLTLGIYSPISIEYVCAKKPAPIRTTDD